MKRRKNEIETENMRIIFCPDENSEADLKDFAWEVFQEYRNKKNGRTKKGKENNKSPKAAK